MHTFKNLWLYIAIIANGLVVSIPSFTNEGATLEEIIVTARKQEESAQDVPIAITAISEQLRNSSVRDLEDLNGYAPNVQIGEDGSRGGGGANITIRGISPTRSDDNSFDSPIGVVIDGIYLGSLAGQIIENFDLERVEILRGPQGTLFGKNTVGGVINVVRSRPTGELGARFKATVGQDGQQELRGVLNAPISDTLSAKLFVTTIQEDGWIENITLGGDQPEVDYKNYGATLLFEPNDRFEALVTLERFDDNSDLDAYHTNYNMAPGVANPPTDPRDADYSGGQLSCILYPTSCRTSLDIPEFSENDKEQIANLEVDALTLNMRYDLNDNLTLVSVTGYRDMLEYRRSDFDGSSAPYITIERNNTYDQFSQELRLDGNFDSVSFTGGLYYFQNEFEQDWYTGDTFWASLLGAIAYDPVLWGVCQAGGLGPNTNCDLGITPNITPGENVIQILYETQETTSYAAFAQADWSVTDDIVITAGLRWTREEKDFIAGQAYYTTEARQALRNFPDYAVLSKEWTELSPKLGISYQINDDSLIYASYSEGFHSGGFFGVNQNKSDFERDQYEPEYAASYEIGYKSLHLDNRLRLNITAFLNDFEDKQESSVQADPSTNTVTTVFDNVADAEYSGWELETEYVFNENFSAFFNYGYLDASYKEFETDINANDGLTIIEDASFLTPRNAPEFTYGVGGTLSIPLETGSIEIFAKYSKVDDIESNLLNTDLGFVAARDDLTATIGYYTDEWSIVVFGTNLQDERFETFFPIDAPGLPLFAVGSLNRPRHVGIEFEYNIR